MTDPLAEFRIALGRIGRQLQDAIQPLQVGLAAIQEPLRDLGRTVNETFRRLEEYAEATYGYPGAFHDILVVVTADDRKRRGREYRESFVRLRDAARRRSQKYGSLEEFIEGEFIESVYTEERDIPPIYLPDHRWSIAVFLAAAEVGPKSSPAWAIRQVLRRALNHGDRELRGMKILIPRRDTVPLPEEFIGSESTEEDESVPLPKEFIEEDEGVRGVSLGPIRVVDHAEPKGDIRRYFWPPPTATEGRVLDALVETRGDREAAREMVGMSASTFRVHLHNLRKKRISGI